jgi:serine/threonine protein kinase
MLPSSYFCDVCGAANRAQAQFCRVCGNAQPLVQNTGLVPNTGIYSLTSTHTGLLVPQTQLRGRYMIVSLAGRGGYGAVYKARDTSFGDRLVAIKEMSQSTMNVQDLASATEAFHREALLLANLTHPNLPRIYEQFTENGRSYLVMDFVEGETLEQLVKKLPNQRMAVEDVLNIALQLCSVLEYLHGRQPPIIFRDLKPANVMMTPAGHIFLIDFGIARHFKPGQKKDTAALGSSGYAPPEQYGKSQTTIRADIYSLGATLHELLSGHDPTDSPFRFAPLHLNDLSLSGLEELILGMVSIDINSRPATISLVRQDLQQIAAQHTIHLTNPLQSPIPRRDSAPRLSASHPSVSHLPAGLPPNLSKSAATPAVSPSIPSPSHQAHRNPGLAPQPAPIKKTPRPTQHPAVYPQANTLYICLGHASRVTSVAWSPNGDYLASASFDKTVHIWNGANGSNLLTYRGHTGRVNALAWSPDSKYIASASDDRTVHLWDVQTGKNLFTYVRHKGPVTALAWSPDGHYIASAGEDRSVHIWDVQAHQAAFTYSDHKDRVMGVAWSPDGHLLASVSRDQTVKICEVEKNPPKRTFFSRLFSPYQGRRTLNGFNSQLQSIAWSPNSKRIAVACSDSRVRIRDARSGVFYLIIVAGSATIKNSVDWSPNGKYLAFGGNDKLVRIWNVIQKKETFAYYGHNGYVLSVAWSPDGTRVASAGVDRSIQVWQAL